MSSALHEELAATLEEITPPGGLIRAFYLRQRPGSHYDSTLIVFTPDGIALMGDCTPGHFGNVSSPGYGLEWFAVKRDPDYPEYLASKFIRLNWQPMLAADWVENEIQSSTLSEEKTAALSSLVPRLRHHGLPQHEFIEALEDEGYADASEIGIGYDPEEARKLMMIQALFSALYAKLEPGGLRIV